MVFSKKKEVEKYYKIQLPSGQSQNISIERFKLVYSKNLSLDITDKPQSPNKFDELLNSSLKTTETPTNNLHQQKHKLVIFTNRNTN